MKFKTKLILCYIALTITYLLASYFSIGVYHYDEHYQIIEFARYKLNLIPESELAWEYNEKIRPWLGPSIAYLIYQLLSISGEFEIESWLFSLRIFSAILGVLCIYLIASSFEKFENKKNKFLAFYFTGFVFYLPMLIVRSSSENLSGIFFWYGVSTLILTNDSKKKLFYLIGILWGIAFLFRFQIAFSIFGTFLWAFFINKNKLISLFQIILGFLVILLIGIFIDAWGYQQFTFTPFNYFYSNLVSNKSELFGTMPWYGYFNLYDEEFYKIGFFLLLIIILFCIIQFKHVYSWAIAPFLLIHFIIPHKETRFLFPIFYIMIPIILILLQRIKENFSKLKLNLIFKSLISLNFVFVFYFIFYPPEKNFSVIYFLRKNFYFENYIYYNINNPFLAKNIDQMKLKLYEIKPKSIKQIHLNELDNLKKPFLYIYYSNYFLSEPIELKNNCKMIFETPKFNYPLKLIKNSIFKILELTHSSFYQIYKCE